MMGAMDRSSPPPSRPKRPHSIEYFDVTRHYWWNYDFVALMSQRWQLDRVTRALDVGCGVGHWTAILRTFLLPGAQLYGIDREEAWLAIARDVVKGGHPETDTRFQQGLAESLPFPDGSFDMVTCQTLLVHHPDPLAVLTEMRRVLEPNGLLVIIEPNNLVQALVANSVTATDPVETVLARVRLRLVCERGRAALGEGDFSVGDRVPGLVAGLGFKDVRVHLSDKTLPLLPPYTTEEQGVVRDAWLSPSFDVDADVWSRDDAARYFLAGGGTADELAELQAHVEETNVRQREAVQAGTFERPGARTMYLVSARK
jgi:SAM-dependent methyltransferase